MSGLALAACTPASSQRGGPQAPVGTSLGPPAPALSVAPAHAAGGPDQPTDASSTRWSNPALFRPIDIFELEWASEPRVSPDGRRVVYVRNSMDIMTDRRRQRLWSVGTDGADHRPVRTGAGDCASPRFSPSGDRLLYVCRRDGRAQIEILWLDSGQHAAITHLTESPSNVTWSPDGAQIAFTMRVPSASAPLAALPKAPEGASWAPPPRVIDELLYRVDGVGYLPGGYTHVFVVPADGGSPRQVTSGDFHHGGTPVFTPDGRALVLSANRHPDWQHRPYGSELYQLDLDTGALVALTRRDGPDHSPALSPDGRYLAYLGFDDTRQSYRVQRLYLLDRQSGDTRELVPDLDRSVSEPLWAPDGSGLFVRYDDRGNTKLARVGIDGRHQVVAEDLGGLSLGRPYGGAHMSVGRAGQVAFTTTRPDHPADVAVYRAGAAPRRLTDLNRDLLGHKRLAQVESFWLESAHDGQKIQAWLMTPPGFDQSRRYPLILEIHGGPFANYGDRFSAECQLYAAAGYAVLYVNPRGSTSYGEDFGNLIHHAYPGRDYDDLMSAVDAAVERGFIDPERLYVTGGSGGGVLTSWIIGKTERFRAAVVAKPVINWLSFVLTADFASLFAGYWFPGLPWEHPEHYYERSPISLVGDVTTPTMLLTGEDDYRTPISESEQYYQALKLRKVDAVLVRIPGASHGIARRPSQLMAKVLHILAWFDRYPERPAGDAGDPGPRAATPR
ncbi:MAG: S9 family peptidase [Haliangiales bacterium]